MSHSGTKRPGCTATVVDGLWNCREIASFRSEDRVGRGGRLRTIGAIRKARRLARELNEWDAREEAAGR